MTKILIADDHRLFNDGLKYTFDGLYTIVSQVFHGRDVLPEVLKHSPHLVFLDINLPGMNGLELGKILKKDFPEIKLLYLSMYNESSFIRSAKELGANGYLLKDSSGDEIVDAVKKILEGGSVFCEIRESNLHHEDYFVKNFSLSKREVEVISLIRQGCSSEEIAKKMHLSYETIKSHRKNIFYKLNISKVSELVRFAIQFNL